MSIQIVEIAQPSVIDTVAVAQPSTVAVVEVRQGPAGADGPAVINAATTSDGTADLLLSNVETVTAEVTGTLIAPHIHGNLAGSVYAHVRAGEALEKGDPVYVSGSHGSGADLIAIVSKADASNAAKMPAVGIVDEDIANNANGHMVIAGTITELNTAAYSINAELYVAAGGGMTATPPTARAQPVARVERANANNGAILVKVNGLSASDATPSTLVRRTSEGGASFGPLSALAGSGNQHSISSSAGTNIIGPLALSGSTGDTLTATYNAAITLNSTTGVNVNGGPLALTQTWNDAAVTYTGLQVNITDSASNAASLLMDLQVGGASKAKFRKDGLLTCFAISATSSGSNFASITSSSSGVFLQSGGRLALSNTGFFGFSPSGDATGTLDLQLHRDAASTLAQRNGNGINAAQTFRLYNTYTSSTNFERLNFRWDSNVAKIGTEKGSASPGGTARDLVLETDGTERVRVTAAGAVTMGGSISANVGNTHDIGGLTGTKFRDICADRILQVGGGGSIRFEGRSRVGSQSDGLLRVSNSSESDFNRLQLGGTTSSFPAIKRTGSDIEIVKADGTAVDTAIILASPDGTRYRVTVANGGALTTTAL